MKPYEKMTKKELIDQLRGTSVKRFYRLGNCDYVALPLTDPEHAAIDEAIHEACCSCAGDGVEYREKFDGVRSFEWVMCSQCRQTEGILPHDGYLVRYSMSDDGDLIVDHSWALHRVH